MSRDLSRGVGPGWRDWLLVALSAVFTVAGVFVAWRTGESEGYAVATFFGGCLAVALWMLAGRFRARRDSLAPDADLLGDEVLRTGHARPLLMGSGATVVGVVMAVAGRGVGVEWVWAAWALATMGLIPWLLRALGRLPVLTLQFRNEGLLLGQRGYTYLLEWDNLAHVTTGDLGGHDLLLLTVRDVERLCQTIRAPEARGDEAAHLRRRVDTMRRWHGADVVLMPVTYGTTIAQLTKSLNARLQALPVGA